MHVPYLFDRNITDNEGCIDGSFPHIFKIKSNKSRKILFINLQSIDKIINIIYIKNEKNLYPRLFNGLLEMHKFFSDGKNTNMYSYVNEWSIRDIFLFRLREIIYTLIIYIFSLGLHIDYFIPNKWKQEKIVQKYINIFKKFMERYNYLFNYIIYIYMADKHESKIKIFYNSDLSLSIVYFEIVVYILVCFLFIRAIILSISYYVNDKRDSHIPWQLNTKLVLNNAAQISITAILFIEILKLFYIKTYKQLIIISGIMFIKIGMAYMIDNEIQQQKKDLSKYTKKISV